MAIDSNSLYITYFFLLKKASSMETPPYLRFNKNLLSIAGLWPHQQKLTKNIFFIILIFLTTTQTIFQIIGAILARENVDMFMETIPNILGGFTTAVKITNFYLNSHKMKKLLVNIENDWIEYKNGPELLILKKYAKFSNKLTLLYFGIFWGAMTPFLAIPIVPIIFNIFVSKNDSIQRQHLYAQYEYVFDSDKYYYPVLIHSYIGSFAFINAIVAIDTMITIYIEHACALFSIIGYNLKIMQNNHDVDMNLNPYQINDGAFKNVINCIKKHNRVLQYVKLLDNANSISYFFQLGIDVICLSFTGFQIATKIDTSPDAAMRFAAFSISLLVVLYFLSYPGQQLIDHSIKICHNIYKANWYCTSLRTRKLLIFMAMRSSIPCQITAGKLYVMNITSFRMVVKTSISYVTVLLSVRE